MATKIWTGSSADWSTAGNWSPSGVPEDDDDVYLENSSQSITAGLGQSGIELTSLNIDQSFTGSLGGTASGPLSITTDTLNIGYHNGPGTPAGSPSVYINLGALATNITVSNSGTSADSARAPIRLLGSAANNDLTVRKGKVEFGTNTDDITSKLRNVVVSYDTRVTSDADLFIGSGVTIATSLVCQGGDTVVECNCPLSTIHDGTLLFAGAWTSTPSIIVYGGTVTSNSTGTLTTCNIYGGTVDFTKSSVDRTVTNLNLGKPGVLKFNQGDMTLSNGVTGADLGQNITYTAS